MAFVRRDYPHAAASAMEILNSGVSLGMAQILLISLRRMGMSQETEEIASGLRVGAGSDPWESALFQVTMGQREPASVLAEAHSALQRCQAALCYIGSHLLTTGDIEAGRAHLQECLGMNVDCFERQIAAMETDLVDRWIDSLAEPTDEVDRLRSMYTGLRSKGHHEQSIHIAYLALSIVVRLHGQYHPDTGRCLNELAMAYAAVGNYDRAEPLLEDALQLVMLFDGVSSEAYATVLDNLAQAKSAKDQLRDAEKLHRLALESFTRAVGRDHPSYATCLGNLAMVCRKLGKYAEAERLYIEAVDVRRRAFGVDDVRHIGMLDGLTDLYLDMGRLGAAETRVKEVVEIVGRMAGKRSEAYGSRLKQLAACTTGRVGTPTAPPCCRRR